MKTWWDFYPLMIFMVLAPFGVTALPTFVIQRKWVGGGFIREYLMNTVANHLPAESGNAYVEMFATASVFKEYALVLPITLNLSAVCAVITFVVFTCLMNLINWMKRSEFQSQRKASKGA